MKLRDYLAETRGRGVLATASADGRVDAAIYSRPHVSEDGTVAFIMRQRLTHSNLQSNPYAVYLFMEEEAGFRGLRLFLKKIGEDQNPELLERMTRRHLSPAEDEARGPKWIVYFRIEKALALIGGETIQLK